MATTFVEYTGDGNATKQFSFPSYKESDIKVRVDEVLKTTSTHYNITSYTTTGGGNVVFTSGNIPASPAKIRIYRDTEVDSAKATFTAGSSVKAGDLNNNNTQLLYKAQEEQLPQQIHSYDIDDDAVIATKIKDSAVVRAKIAADAVDGTKIADDSVDSEHYAAGSIDLEHMSANSVDSDQYVDGSIDREHLAADVIDGTKLADNSINSEHYVDGSIDHEHLANDIIDGDNIQDDVINSEHYAAQSIDTEHIANQNVTTAKLASNAITSAKLANDAVTTAKIVNDAVTGAKIAHYTITFQNLADGCVLRDNISDNAVNEDKIKNSCITTDKIVTLAVTGQKIATGAITHSKLGTGSVLHDKLGANAVETDNIDNDAVTTAKIANDAVTADKIADAAIVTASEQAAASANDTTFFTTAAADARYFNISTGDTIKDGQTFPDNDTTIATTAAINDRIIDLVDDVGGFVPIANETSFPTSNPDVNNGTGTIVSVSAASTNLAPSGTTVTIANGRGSGLPVVITGVSATIPSGFGFLVETTTTAHTYTFHRLSPKATEVTTVAGKATEIGRLGTADAVADMAILGTADVVADLNTLGTADVVSDMNTLGTADVVADMNTLAVSSVISDMDTVATNVTNVNNVGGSISNVNTTAGSIANVNTVAGSIANVNTTAGSISNVNTTAGSIANVNTVASNISSVNSFANTYRIGASNPTDSLDVGDLFFNTTSDSLKVYTGSAWVDGVTATGNFALKTGNTFTGSNIHNDDVKSIYGTSSDGLEIFHNGSHSIINDNGTGNLHLQVNAGTKLNLGSTGVSVTGNITVSGNVDGRDVAADGTKLDGIDTGAKDDQTASEIVSLLSDQNIATTGTVATGALTATGTSHLFTSGTSGDCELIIQADSDNNDENDNPKLLLRQDGALDEGAVFLLNNTLNIASSVASGGGLNLRTSTTDSGYLTAPIRMSITPSGQVDFSGNVDCNAGLDVTGHITTTDGSITQSNSSGSENSFGTNINISTVYPSLHLNDTNSENDFKIQNQNGLFAIQDADANSGSGSNRFTIASDGTTTVANNLDVGAGVDVTGNSNLNGDVTVDNGTSTLLNVKCDDGGNAIVRAGGDSQGTGAFEVSQDNGNYGGGISYNGDASPSFVSGEQGDYITFYRISAGTRTEVFSYPYNSNVVKFNSIPTVNGVNLARITDTVSEATNAVNVTGTIASAVTATTQSQGDNSTKVATTAYVDALTVATNLGTSTATGSVTVTSSTGNNATISEASGSAAGVMSVAHHDKLDGIATGATNVTNNNQLTNGAGYITSASFSDVAGGGTFTGDVAFGGGASAVQINAGSDLRFVTGTWTGDTCKIQNHSNYLYIQGASGGILFRDESGTNRWHMNSNGHFVPQANNTYDLGISSNRWRNIYTNDLHLSNEGHSNEMDGTWGNWTIQEGESDLFLKNNRSGKKYKFNLTEVS